MTPKRQPGFGRHEPEALQTPLFVRIPKAEADKLARAAFEQKRPKQEIVASLIARYVDPARRPPAVEAEHEELPVGRHTFRAAPAEVLTPAALAELLQVDEALLVGLAERGEIPARKIGEEWRFSRHAILDWLGTSA